MQTIVDNSLNIRFKYMAGTYIVGEISKTRNLACSGESYMLKIITVTLSEKDISNSHRQCRLAVIQLIPYIIRIKSGRIKCIQLENT